MPRHFTGKKDKRNARGGRRVGAGRKKDIVKQARDEALDEDTVVIAIKNLKKFMASKDEAVAMKATELVLAYKWGRPTQKHATTGAVPLLAVVGVDMADV